MMKRTLIWICLLFLGSFLTFHIPVGDQSARLSCYFVILPLVTYLLPGRFAWLLLGLSYLIRPFPITGGVPTFLAAESWRKRSWLLHIAFPLLAMITFAVAAPGAWPYSLYWLIPVVLHLLPSNLFFRALQATFVQHAAGSLIYLFLIPLSSEQWLALIPVVAVERLLAAALSVGVVGVAEAISAKEGVLGWMRRGSSPSI